MKLTFEVAWSLLWQKKINTNLNGNLKLAISNCASERAIVWEPLARIIGTQHVLINLMNDAH
jgi:hypothetical protein